jgi:pyruvate dehydrogenase E2 component (dihydrolipoamide acetyltransferase)
MAKALGISIDGITGSGPHGRVVKADVTRATRDAAAWDLPQPTAATPMASDRHDSAGNGRTVINLSRLQQTIARRMSESKSTAPDFILEVDVDMTEAIAVRERLRRVAEHAPSLNDFVVVAAAQALRAHPRVNGIYRNATFEIYDRINIGVAVAMDEGLLVPTIFDADRRALGDVADETRRLAKRVRDGSITPLELESGTFTISNLGMFGVDRFAGVINPPQAALLCVGAIARRPAVDLHDNITVRSLMTLTLVSDHRILYGADAARFLAHVRAILEEPLCVVMPDPAAA